MMCMLSWHLQCNVLSYLEPSQGLILPVCTCLGLQVLHGIQLNFLLISMMPRGHILMTLVIP